MHSLDQPENITQDQESLYKISKARAELGIFQHHDGITGTARSSVVEDYGKRMKYAEGLTKEVSETFMAKLAGVDKVSYQDYQHEASIENVIDLSMKSEIHIVFQNQNVENSESLLEVFVNKPDVGVFDKNGKECIGQTEFRHGNVYRLVFKPNDKLGSLGFETFTMTRGNNGEGLTLAAESKTEISGKVGDLAHFDKESGSLTFTHNSETVKIDVLAYLTDVKRKEKEGAYLFLPAGKAQPFQASNTAELKVQTGPLRTIFTVKREESVEYDLIISDDSINLQTRTYLNDKHNNKNICLRFTINGLENNGIYTDMNGINFNYRKRFDFAKIPLQGQFYPMPAAAYISNDANKNFGVVSQQPLAVASLEKGQIDVILDRRLAQDDNRGLGQPIKDNRFSVLNFKLLANAKPNPGGESNIFETELLKSSTNILRPPVRFISENKPSVMSKALINEDKSSLFKKCELELGGVFLPSYFDEYEKNSYGSSKVNVLLRSYKSRSSCENECGYEKLEFLKLFSGSGKDFKMKAVNLLGKEFTEDSGIFDTSPLQAYLLE
jgi:alpha-mannosidase II